MVRTENRDLKDKNQRIDPRIQLGPACRQKGQAARSRDAVGPFKANVTPTRDIMPG